MTVGICYTTVKKKYDRLSMLFYQLFVTFKESDEIECNYLNPVRFGFNKLLVVMLTASAAI
jgi:hypothetical protein